MQATDKFRSDIDQVRRRARGQGESVEREALRSLFFRSFPKVGGEALAALFAAYLERRATEADSASDWLAGVGSVLMMDYNGFPFETSDWAEIREAVALEEEKLDMELLQYVMALVVDHGAL